MTTPNRTRGPVNPTTHGGSQTKARSDVQWFYYGGALLSVLSLIFLYRELSLDIAWILSIVAVVFAAMSILKVPAVAPVIAPAGLLVCLVMGTGLWYLAQGGGEHSAALAAAVNVCAAGAIVGVFLGRGQGVPADEHLAYHRAVQWYAMTLALMAASWTLYLNVLTFGRAQGDDFSGPRRMVLTLGWLLTGAIMVWASLKGNRRYLKHAGITFTAVAFAKALVYDTSKMESFWRVGVLAVAGVVLLGMGAVLQSAQGKEDA